jgi:hypothetical protein
MYRSRLSRLIFALILALWAATVRVSAAQPAPTDLFKTWPPRAFLIKTLVKSVEETISTFHPETGYFGTDPWICLDQNVLLPLAAAWSIKDPANPYYHNPELLAMIGKGGEALVDNQDKDGKWLFRKKDNSTWGMIYMPWTYGNWIRAYMLVKDALPKPQRAKWEKGLLLGFDGISKTTLARILNIPCYDAMALYLAGVAFQNEAWKKQAWDFERKVLAAQAPEGYWSENSGPVVSYNMVYIDALGAYYAFSKDPAVVEALNRAVKFHGGILWSDGSSAACIDERVPYERHVNTGNIGFTYSAEGRRFILSQLAKAVAAGREGIDGDTAASLLLYGGQGPVAPPAGTEDKGITVLGKNEAVIVRDKPWEWAFSAYTTKPVQNRWIQDRQNYVDIFNADLGLVAGGGNTKLQPYWSTFTVDDRGFLRHRAGDEDPNFIPQIDLLWTADRAAIVQSGNPTKMTLKYGDIECAVTVESIEGGRVALVTYEAPRSKTVEAHLPLMALADSIRTGKGDTFILGEKELVLDAENIGRSFDFGRLRVAIPEGASIHWPAMRHNPYTKDGHSELGDARLVVVLPFEKTNIQSVSLTVHQ